MRKGIVAGVIVILFFSLGCIGSEKSQKQLELEKLKSELETTKAGLDDLSM